ncbi:MAG: helix-turn-helix domain-containing protein, partial [Candidatus Dormibacteria bacterium]
MARLTEAELRETAAAYNAAQGNEAHAADALRISRPTLHNRLGRLRREFPQFLKEWPLARGGPPRKELATLEEDVTRSRIEERDRHRQSRLLDALREISRLQDEIKDLRWASNAGFTPAEWTYEPRRGGKSEHMPYLLTSDFQAGEVIRAEETETGYG